MARALSVIAREIYKEWPKVNYAAKPYLEAMATLESTKENFYAESGKSIVIYFLSNAGSWRGDAARRIKAELTAMVK